MSLRPITQLTASTWTGNTAKTPAIDERDADAPCRAREEPEEQRDVRRVEHDVAEVVSDGVPEAEDARVERPGDVAEQQRLLAREIA